MTNHEIIARLSARTARYATTWPEDICARFAANLVEIFGSDAIRLSAQAFGDCLRAWEKMPSSGPAR